MRTAKITSCTQTEGCIHQVPERGDNSTVPAYPLEPASLCLPTQACTRSLTADSSTAVVKAGAGLLCLYRPTQ